MQHSMFACNYNVNICIIICPDIWLVMPFHSFIEYLLFESFKAHILMKQNSSRPLLYQWILSATQLCQNRAQFVLFDSMSLHQFSRTLSNGLFRQFYPPFSKYRITRTLPNSYINQCERGGDAYRVAYRIIVVIGKAEYIVCDQI